MGKIFGISDNPVTIFTTPLEPVQVPKPEYKEISRFSNFSQPADKFVSSVRTEKNSNKVIKFLNRIVKNAAKK